MTSISHFEQLKHTAFSGCTVKSQLPSYIHVMWFLDMLTTDPPSKHASACLAFIIHLWRASQPSPASRASVTPIASRARHVPVHPFGRVSHPARLRVGAEWTNLGEDTAGMVSTKRRHSGSVRCTSKVISKSCLAI